MSQRLYPSDYTIAWIAVLRVEAEAALGMLDTRHAGYFETTRGEDYLYIPGSINNHNVVIITLPVGQNYGVGAAAALVNQVKTRFPNIWFALLVGVAAGLPKLDAADPKQRRDIRLGDVLVCVPEQSSSGVVQYDLGRDTDEGFILNGRQSETPAIVRSAIGQIALTEKSPFRKGIAFAKTLEDFQTRQENGEFDYPGQEHDILYKQSDGIKPVLVKRKPRDENLLTRVWYGSIGSGNSLMRNPERRDKLRDKYGLIGLEMEAAGVMNVLPTGVIRGVCDYGDGFKNKTWQPYAAAVAAVYARGILCTIHPSSDGRITNSSPSGLYSADKQNASLGKESPTLATKNNNTTYYPRSRERLSDDLLLDQTTANNFVNGHQSRGSPKRTRYGENDDIRMLLRQMCNHQSATDQKLAKMYGILSRYQGPSNKIPSKLSKMEHYDPSCRIQSKLTSVKIHDILENLASTSGAFKLDEVGSLKACAIGLGQRERGRARGDPHHVDVWHMTEVRSWNSAPKSTLLSVSAAGRVRTELCDFCIRAIDVLNKDRVPVIWALNSPRSESNLAVNIIDVLVSLAFQALQFVRSSLDQSKLERICKKLQRAKSEHDWFAILAKIISDLPFIYIIVDLALLADTTTSCETTFSWTEAFSQLFHELDLRSKGSVIKVLVLNGESSDSMTCELENKSVVSLSIGRTSLRAIPISQRRMAGIRSSLKDFKRQHRRAIR